MRCNQTSDNIIKSIRIHICIMLSLCMGLYAVPLYAQEFGVLYGTYKLHAIEKTVSGYETYTAFVLIGRARHSAHEYGFAVYPKPSRYVGGKIRKKKQHFELLYKSTGSNPNSYKTQLHSAFCQLEHTTDSSARLAQTMLNCTGNMRAKSNKGKFTITRLTGKTETDLLEKLFNIKAGDFKDEFKLVDKQHKTHLIFKKSKTNFLNVHIKNAQNSFIGVAKPSDNNRLSIRYNNTQGDTYLTDCALAFYEDRKQSHLKTKAIRWMRCEGTLSGLPNRDRGYLFK